MYYTGRLHFQCPRDACILTSYVCDGKSDCDDNLDEVNCLYRPTTQTVAAMESKNSTDGREHGREHDQGKYSHADNCTDLYVPCVSGECIPRDHQCDGRADCTDVSDEVNCHTRQRGSDNVLDINDRNAFISSVSHCKSSNCNG